MAAARRALIALALLVGLLVAGLAVDELASDRPERARVTVTDANATTLGELRVRVADSFRERYVGLSLTDSLGPNEGVLFVHGREDNYSYVMRGMSFPIDIVFVDADGRITAVHHAEPDSDAAYRGRGVWVLEVPHRWTTRHGVGVGDRVRVAWGA